jgi:raffinose/stachyose/melibiose transport system substrate-binding protein
MFQINDNVTDDELDAIMKFLDFFFEQQNVDAYPGLYGLPIPQLGREGGIPPENVNVPGIFAAANANGAFTISDQALPPIVCDALFTVLDDLALSRVTPAEAASFMQRAIERHESEG